MQISNKKELKVWNLEKTLAETWDGKNGAPNLSFDVEDFLTLQNARKALQNEIAKICQNKNVERITWLTDKVDISYNYLPDDGSRIEATLSMSILEYEPGKVKWVGVGNYPEGNK